MEPLYDKIHTVCTKDGKGVASLPAKQSDNHPISIVESRVLSAAINVSKGQDPQTASLEGLAVESQWEILQHLTSLPSLHAIVRASPVYHRAHMARRQSILTQGMRDEG